MAEITQDAVPGRPSSQPPTKPSRKKWFWWAVLAVMALLSWWIFVRVSATPTDQSKSFLTALYRSTSAATDEGCGDARIFPEQRDELMRQGWKGKALITSERIVRTRERTGRDIAYVDAALPTSKGTQVFVVLVLGKDPMWCVSGIRIQGFDR
jgi:hypothetical protein